MKQSCQSFHPDTIASLFELLYTPTIDIDPIYYRT